MGRLSTTECPYLPTYLPGECTEPTPSKTPVCVEQGLSPRGVSPEPLYVERALFPKLGFDETVELLTRVFGASEEDPELSALCAAFKTNPGLSDLEKPQSTMAPRVKLLTKDMKSSRGIRSSPMDTCPSPLNLCVRTVPVCSLGDTSVAEMKSYGLSALAPSAMTQPPSPSDGTGDTGVPGRGMKAIATATLLIELLEFDATNLREWAEEFPEFFPLTGQQHANVKTKCTLSKKSCRKKVFQRQVKTAIRRSSNLGDF